MAFGSFQSSPYVKMLWPSALVPSGASVTAKMISAGLIRLSSACLESGTILSCFRGSPRG